MMCDLHAIPVPRHVRHSISVHQKLGRGLLASQGREPGSGSRDFVLQKAETSTQPDSSRDSRLGGGSRALRPQLPTAREGGSSVLGGAGRWPTAAGADAHQAQPTAFPQRPHGAELLLSHFSDEETEARRETPRQGHREGEGGGWGAVAGFLSRPVAS